MKVDVVSIWIGDKVIYYVNDDYLVSHIEYVHLQFEQSVSKYSP